MEQREKEKNGESMENIEKIKKEVLEEIKPTERERKELLKLFEEIKGKIKEFDEENTIEEIDLVGSVGKDTFLRGNRDLDIFLFFNKNIDREVLENKGLEIGKMIFNHYKEKYVIKYAEHPYVKGKIKGFDIEIVPAYKLKEGEKIKSAVDRTPFHKKYIIENLKNKDEVLILKKFLKSIGVYGSELYVRGFSGYACELFIIKYKSFDNFIKHAKNFRYREVVCLTPCNVKETLSKFKNDAFIMIDPVDKNRNVCSAVSKQSLAKLRYYANLFYEKPNKKFFFIDQKDFSKEVYTKLKNLNKYWFVVVFENKEEEIKDVVFPQQEKFRKYLLREYEKLDFNVERSFSFNDNETFGFYFEFGFKQPSKKRLVKGPSVFSRPERIKGFINKYSGFWINESGELNALQERKFLYPEEVLTHLTYLNEKEAHQLGVPKTIAKNLKSMKIIKNHKDIKSEDFIKKFVYESIITSFLI